MLKTSPSLTMPGQKDCGITTLTSEYMEGLGLALYHRKVLHNSPNIFLLPNPTFISFQQNRYPKMQQPRARDATMSHHAPYRDSQSSAGSSNVVAFRPGLPNRSECQTKVSKKIWVSDFDAKQCNLSKKHFIRFIKGKHSWLFTIWPNQEQLICQSSLT